MSVDEATPRTVEETPAELAYRETAEEHADRVYGLSMLLVGDSAVALQITIEAFARLWEGIRRDQLFGDATEQLYWTATRSALRRIGRSRGELRGLLPATIAEDNQITAFGITSGFPPQQQAAIYLAVWAGLDYRVAGLVSGVGEARARDLAFSARQEYREARGVSSGVNALCNEAAPLLSARADGESMRGKPQVEAHVSSCNWCRQVSENFDEFGEKIRAIRIPSPPESPVDAALAVPRSKPRATGRSRFFRLMLGPAILTLVLIVSLFVFRGFAEPSIGTGLGRTSDLVFSLDRNGALLIVDSGSGRELGKLPNGVLTSNGQRVYSVAQACQGESPCTSTLRQTDTATLSGTPIGRVDGQLYLMGVDEERGRIYLAPGDGSRLAMFDTSAGQIVDGLDAPSDTPGAFSPERAILSADGQTLFTLASDSDAGQTALVATDLSAPRVRTVTALPGSRADYATLLPEPGGSRLFAHQIGSGAMQVVDLVGGRVAGSVQLADGARPTGPLAPNAGTTLAQTLDGTSLYAVVHGQGLAAVKPDVMQVVNRLAPDQEFRSVAASSEGGLLYVIGDDASYAVLQASDGKQLLRRPNFTAVGFLQVNPGE